MSELEREALDRLQSLLDDLRQLTRTGTVIRAEGWSWPSIQVKQLLEALLVFLGLHPQERGFVRALAENRTDDTTLGAFADWLEEHGQDEAGRRVRLLRPQPGDTLVVWRSTLQEPDLTNPTEQARRALGVAQAMILNPGQDIRLLPVDVMRQHGWVRVEETRARPRGSIIGTAGANLEAGQFVTFDAEGRLVPVTPRQP